MGEPAAVMGDQIIGNCPMHLIVNPATGAPQPSPVPLPFSAALVNQLATTVQIGGKPAVVAGSWGLNAPPHPIHATDPYFAPLMQKGTVVSGSATVMFDGLPAAKTGSPSLCCSTPGNLVGSAATVLIGG
jgi:uncharacterized Zn-binding protein involved in type VI secretion